MIREAKMTHSHWSTPTWTCSAKRRRIKWRGRWTRKRLRWAQTNPIPTGSGVIMMRTSKFCMSLENNTKTSLASRTTLRRKNQMTTFSMTSPKLRRGRQQTLRFSCKSKKGRMKGSVKQVNLASLKRAKTTKMLKIAQSFKKAKMTKFKISLKRAGAMTGAWTLQTLQ